MENRRKRGPSRATPAARPHIASVLQLFGKEEQEQEQGGGTAPREELSYAMSVRWIENGGILQTDTENQREKEGAEKPKEILSFVEAKAIATHQNIVLS